MSASATSKNQKKGKSVRFLRSEKAKLLKYLDSVKEEDVMPEKNKRAAENLRRAGLI